MKTYVKVAIVLSTLIFIVWIWGEAELVRKACDYTEEFCYRSEAGALWSIKIQTNCNGDYDWKETFCMRRGMKNGRIENKDGVGQ